MAPTNQPLFTALQATPTVGGGVTTRDDDEKQRKIARTKRLQKPLALMFPHRKARRCNPACPAWNAIGRRGNRITV